MDPPKTTRNGFVDKFAGAFTCHSTSLKKDKKRPRLGDSSPECEIIPATGVKKIIADHKKGSAFVDVLKPVTKSDLLIHPKKLLEVECWFKALYGRRSPSPSLFLVISGPSGCGKLTTIKILARELGIEVIEFGEINYIKDLFSAEDDENDYDYGEQIYNRSQVENMKNFLIQQNVNSLLRRPKNRRLMIIKDFPSTLIKEPEKYHDLWTWYYNEFSSDGVPVVFIISCDPGRDLIKIFPSQLKAQLNVQDIAFNPIVKTRIIKWLTDKLEKKISKQEIELIVEEGNGDIRNILNCFELKCSSSLMQQRPVPSYKRSAKKPRTESQPSIGSSSRSIWGRNVSLELYHFLGKILYSKRDFERPMRRTLPDSMLQFERHHLNENPFQLSDSFDLSPSTLKLFLHQNYLQFAENLESAAATIDWLSQSDCIRDDVYDSDSPLEKYQSCLTIAGSMFNLSPNGHRHGSRPVIVSNRAFHSSYEKTREAKSILKRSFNDRSTSLVTSDLILDLLPYVAVMNSSKKKFPPELLKLALFPQISTHGHSGSQRMFNNQPFINSVDSPPEVDYQDEDDDEKHYYIIDDDSS